MLSELYGIFILIVPVVLFLLSFSKMLEHRMDDENRMHQAVYSFFMDSKCIKKAECSTSHIGIKKLYSIDIREPSKGFNDDKKETENGPLEAFYKEFEEKIKSSAGK